ncbi:MAG: mechanosensitive ion channel domain-containing protein [Planctomycetota bacterium]
MSEPTGNGGEGAASQQSESGGLLLGDLPYAEVIEWLVLTALVIGALVAINYLILVRPTIETRVKNQRRWIMLALTIVAALLVLIQLPVEDDTKKTIIQALGIAVTALITLSSTTIAANLMAGLMLGRVQAFKPGDVIRVVGSNGETFGRVTARGLFHVEVQTDERDLVTLPNSYVITHPVRVVRQSGTIITCDVSIGYDVPHGKLETLLVEAATESGLSDAYVLVRELGDFSVLYRAAGFLKDTKSILSARSKLRTHILDSLHGAGVEIVSPTFMNQRRVEDPVIAVHESEDEKKARSAESPESIVFDKADDAERVERVRKALEEARKSLKSLESELSDASDDERKAELKDDIEHQKTLIEYLTSRVGRLEEQKPADDE